MKQKFSNAAVVVKFNYKKDAINFKRFLNKIKKDKSFLLTWNEIEII